LNKESTHRSNELKEFGWNQEDLIRYEELWEYSQRWGLINLEREDRQFLKKAEKLLPKLQPKKTSNKKPIEEKSYYLWLDYYLKRIKDFKKANSFCDEIIVWEVLIEEEMELLSKYKPVMGLTDSLKAKKLFSIRKDLIKKSLEEFDAKNSDKLFDFNISLNDEEYNTSKSWKSIIENDPTTSEQFPLISKNKIEKYRILVHKIFEEFMINNYPSLKGDL